MPPATSGSHIGQGITCTNTQTEHIHVKHLSPLVNLAFSKRRRMTKPRIVNQNINTTKRFFCKQKCLLNGSLITNITLNSKAIASGDIHLSKNFSNSFLSTGRPNNPHSFSQKPCRNGCPDSITGTSNEGCFPLPLIHSMASLRLIHSSTLFL